MLSLDFITQTILCSHISSFFLQSNIFLLVTFFCHLPPPLVHRLPPHTEPHSSPGVVGVNIVLFLASLVRGAHDDPPPGRGVGGQGGGYEAVHCVTVRLRATGGWAKPHRHALGPRHPAPPQRGCAGAVRTARRPRRCFFLMMSGTEGGGGGQAPRQVWGWVVFFQVCV